MRSGYVSWFLRAARVVPVIAGAALLGGMIGGFAMFAIDSALTWDPAPQSRPDARAENTANAVDPQPNKPVRIVGGAIPDPSAGMSAPPPVQQPQPPAPGQSQTQLQSQVSPQLLMAKPLGPASHLQPQTAPASASTSAPQNQTTNQPQVQTSLQTPVATPTAPTAPQQTRWPDALSRAHQNAATAANPPGAQQLTAPAPAQGSEAAANKNHDADRNNTERAVNADDQDRAQDRARVSRRDRHSRRHTVTGGSGYDRLYDSNGNRRDRNVQDSYGNARESYGDARGQSYRNDRDDQGDAAARSDQTRSDQRQYGRDTRSRGRSRVIVREQPDENDRSFNVSRPRPEPFWGRGLFRRGYQDDD